MFPASVNGDRRKKLLVLNFGGLLYEKCLSRKDIPDNRLHDFKYGRKRVFKRPFYEEFLEFCFERFDVGVWSSIQSQYLYVVLENIMGESKSKLKFVWHQAYCTKPGYKWVNSEKKPIFLKNLKKLSMEPNLSHHFSLSNTLLIDNAPYIGLLNPRNTAIYPYPYVVSNAEDNFLGPEGEMRLFLDGLANAKDVPSYVEENRIGQPALTPSHSDWGYYSEMLTLIRSREAVRRKSKLPYGSQLTPDYSWTPRLRPLRVLGDVNRGICLRQPGWQHP